MTSAVDLGFDTSAIKVFMGQFEMLSQGFGQLTAALGSKAQAAAVAAASRAGSGATASIERYGSAAADIQRDHGAWIGRGGLPELQATMGALQKLADSIQNNTGLTEGQRAGQLRQVEDQRRSAVAAGVGYVSSHATVPFQAPSSVAEFAADIEVTRKALADLAEVTRQAGRATPETMALQDQLNASLSALQIGMDDTAKRMGPQGALAGALDGLAAIASKMGTLGSIVSIGQSMQSQMDQVGKTLSTKMQEIYGNPNNKDASGNLNATGQQAASTAQSGAANAGKAIAISGAISIIADILQKAAAFRTIVATFEDMFQRVADVLSRLLQPFEAFFYVLDTVVGVVASSLGNLGPIFDIVGQIVFYVAKALGLALEGAVLASQYFMLGIEMAVNGIVQGVKWLVDSVGAGGTDFGKAMHAAAEQTQKWVDDQQGAIDETQQSIGDLWNLTYEDATQRSEKLDKATQSAAQSLNELSGYIQAAAKYDAAQAGWKGPRHASGGTVWAPEIALVGEAGPEDIVPHARRSEYVQQLLGGSSYSDHSSSVNIQIGQVILPSVRDAAGFVREIVNDSAHDVGGLPFVAAPQFVGGNG